MRKQKQVRPNSLEEQIKAAYHVRYAAKVIPKVIRLRQKLN